MSAKPDSDDELVLAMAKAMNGPHDAMPANSRYSLNEVRAVRWNCTLTEQDRQYLLRQARAALAQSRSSARTGEGELRAVGLE
jgi:hypothetical protein